MTYIGSACDVGAFTFNFRLEDDTLPVKHQFQLHRRECDGMGSAGRCNKNFNTKLY
jgi:hypothetical protein